MPLITRTAKGSKLTISEMDGNLEFLASSSFQDGVYSQTVEGNGEISGSFGSVFSFTNLFDSGTEGTYTVSPTTDGSGTGAQLEITVFSYRAFYRIEIESSLVLNGGSGYAIGDTLTVDLADLGGNAGETVVFTLQSGVDGTKTSTIEVTADEISLSTTKIIFPNLPTTDPGNTGQLWNDSGSLKISAGI
jgi:hypothetical protein